MQLALLADDGHVLTQLRGLDQRFVTHDGGATYEDQLHTYAPPLLPDSEVGHSPIVEVKE